MALTYYDPEAWVVKFFKDYFIDENGNPELDIWPVMEIECNDRDIKFPNIIYVPGAESSIITMGGSKPTALSFEIDIRSESMDEATMIQRKALSLLNGKPELNQRIIGRASKSYTAALNLTVEGAEPIFVRTFQMNVRY